MEANGITQADEQCMKTDSINLGNLNCNQCVKIGPVTNPTLSNEISRKNAPVDSIGDKLDLMCQSV